jgi:hypothetical protein
MPALYETDLVSRLPEVEDSIVMAKADDHPFTALIGSPKESVAKLFSWLGLTGQNPVVSAYADSSKHTPSNSRKPTQLYGMCQELRDDYAVGRQAEAQGTYGDYNNPVKQRKWALERLYLQLERVLCSTQEQVDSAATGGAGTAPTSGPKMRGAFACLWPKDAAGDPQNFLAFADAFRTLDAASFFGALSAFTPDVLKGILKAISEAQGKKASLMMLGGVTLVDRMAQMFIERDIQASGLPFTVATKRNDEMFKIDLTVDTYKFTTGVVRTAVSYNLAYNLSTGLPTTQTPLAGLLMDPSKWKLRKNFPLEHVPLDDEGQGKSGFYRMMPGLECQMPLHQGIIYPSGLTTPEGA